MNMLTMYSLNMNFLNRSRSRKTPSLAHKLLIFILMLTLASEVRAGPKSPHNYCRSSKMHTEVMNQIIMGPTSNI